MNYEDEEILWVSEHETLNDIRWNVLANANLVIRINLSKNTFDVFKCRWGNNFENAPLNLLDCFLENPMHDWVKIINESDVDNKPILV